MTDLIERLEAASGPGSNLQKAQIGQETAMTKRKPYPAWICSECGDQWGRRECGVATWHTNACCICGERRAVTEPRDFGHLKKGWENA